MQNVTLSVDLVNSILQYLSSKPFAEVFGLIETIRKEAAQSSATQAPIPAEAPVQAD